MSSVVKSLPGMTRRLAEALDLRAPDQASDASTADVSASPTPDGAAADVEHPDPASRAERAQRARRAFRGSGSFLAHTLGAAVPHETVSGSRRPTPIAGREAMIQQNLIRSREAARSAAIEERVGSLSPDVATDPAPARLPGNQDLRHVLKELGYDDVDLPTAIRQLQEDAGLTITGELDLETLLAIVTAVMNRDRRSVVNASSPHGGVAAGARAGGAEYATAADGGAADLGRTPVQTAPVDVASWQPGAGDVSPGQLKSIVPTLSDAKAAEVAPHLNRAMAEAGIDSPARKAAFIAQLAHESGGFQYHEEIASGRAYEGRADLGNTQPGDGERFKGRGFIQLTGRANYAAAGKALGLDLVNHPELAAKPENAARVAAWYWNSRGLNGLADKGSFDEITRRINGGLNGKADRDQYHARAVTVLKDSMGLPSTGRFVADANEGAAGKVDTNHPHLKALANGPLVGARTGLCVTATLDNMQRNGVPQPAATGSDVGNNPRGGMVQMIKNNGWRSLPGLGRPETIKSPYGTVQANVIDASEYERLAKAGQIPSGAVVFQTRHASWNETSPGSRGFDMGIARNGGRNLFNFADMGGAMVYPDTRSVVVLVPGAAIK